MTTEQFTHEQKYTKIDKDIWVCNDCGAHAASTDKIIHHETCHPGESERWQKHYGEMTNDH